MLFDLSGKRRRVVQATYLVLAILLGGGLVLFGVGSGNISGGLFDAITGKDSNSNSSVNSAVSSRIKRDQKALQLNPKNQAALADLVRAHYQLATDDADPNTGAFGSDGKAELQKASSAWNRYVAVVNKPSDSLASLMLQAYSEGGLNKADKAAEAAELIANARPSAQAYLTLTLYAAKAGQTRKAELAGLKAVDLAPKSQKKLVKKQVAVARSQGQAIGPSDVTPSTGGTSTSSG
jgi:tetratricopeptide (TPR) repeat protein